MTIDDMPRTFDITAGKVTGIGITAVPGLGTSRVLSTSNGVLVDEMPDATVHIGGPDRSTGAVRGSVEIVDRGAAAMQFGPALFTTAKGGVVSVDTRSGRFTYTPSVQARQVARLSPRGEDKVDTFSINVADGHGRSIDADVTVGIFAGNVPPTGAAKVGMPLESGVVVGHIDAAAWDGAKLTFSLANSSNPADSTAESAYSQKGGLVQLDTKTGRFTFVPRISNAELPGRDTDRFVITATDAQGGTADVTVVALAHLKIGVETTGTGPGVQCGKLVVTPGGPLLYSLGVAPSKGTVAVHANGTYTYTRSPVLSRGDGADDCFTIIGTDDYGRSLTVTAVDVCPPLTSRAPVTGTVKLKRRDSAPKSRTVGASGRMRGLSTGDWTTVIGLNSENTTCAVHQFDPRGFVMMARTAPGKWAVHYESMSPKSGARYPSETFVVTYRNGELNDDGSPVLVEVTYEF